MTQDLSNKREIYSKYSLVETHLPKNPIELFKNWYEVAENQSEIREANAMLISTVEEGFRPRTRIVLLKKYSNLGFEFYTNYESRKGKALTENPEICLHFFWQTLERQISISAKVEKLEKDVSDAYFHSRPKGSQLGALVSPQSEVIPNREYLEKKLTELEEKFAEKEIPRPENWGGYIAKPYQIEFWQGRPNRLHDRILYTLENENWKIERLAP